ncbi:hypothetical protein SmJEL517_g00746 [Synchytrium microbalum]|uniref:Protein YIP n=1 Tax=Synchytrium microbalum TaxID=1806994 RepID=A0A507CIG4_9FUNG|nr:uncharacterized protein SmJEL517_g00746 [Synchytrium microbalum]TPX37443.1 hypothetical protein SmJEL517_g00746 [Synchytrium microbalum]
MNNQLYAQSGAYAQQGLSQRTLDTLDEPVSETLLRDLRAIRNKLMQVLIPRGNKDLLRDWDLWGPLLLCLTLAIRLGITAPADQSAIVFTSIFVIIWFGAAVVSVNSNLLGGKVSFYQSICVLGYCIFPLVLTSIISLFVPYVIFRFVFVGIAFTWSTYASVGFLDNVQLNNRRILAVYPIFLFYFIIAWMVLISKSLFG